MVPPPAVVEGMEQDLKITLSSFYVGEVFLAKFQSTNP